MLHIIIDYSGSTFWWFISYEVVPDSFLSPLQNQRRKKERCSSRTWRIFWSFPQYQSMCLCMICIICIYVGALQTGTANSSFCILFMAPISQNVNKHRLKRVRCSCLDFVCCNPRSDWNYSLWRWRSLPLEQTTCSAQWAQPSDFGTDIIVSILIFSLRRDEALRGKISHYHGDDAFIC